VNFVRVVALMPVVVAMSMPVMVAMAMTVEVMSMSVLMMSMTADGNIHCLRVVMVFNEFWYVDFEVYTAK
jgi:hypothetical protein